MRCGILTAVIAAAACACGGTVGAADPAAAARSGEVLLLDFTAAWSGPCRQMAPLVAEVEAAGWLVRHVDVDREADLVRRFGVTGIPCYVLVVQGHEVGRINGATTRRDLEQLLARSAAPLGAAPPAVAAAESTPVAGIPLPVASAAGPLATEPPAPAAAGHVPQEPHRPAPIADPVPGVGGNAAPPAASVPLPNHEREGLERRLMSATARLRVEDASGVSWATGTVIDCRQGEALILTCGHVFRDSQGKGRVTVDLFGDNGPRGEAGQVIAWDLKRDLALVSIFTTAAIEPIRVGGTDRTTPVGAPVVTVGCDGGKAPTLHHSRVTGVDKYLGPSNLQVAGQPVQGRSGGGLFAIDGTLIGVCNAADPADNEGLFAALPSIHEQLDDAGLAFVYRNVYPSGGVDGQLLTASGGIPTPTMPATMPSVSFDRRDRAAAVPTATTAAAHAATVPPPASTAAAHATAVSETLHAAPAAAAAPLPPAALSPGEAALIDHVRQHAGKAEVICIVRPHGVPDAKSEVFVLRNARSDFVDHLSKAHLGQAAATATRSDVAALPAANPVR